MNAHSLVQLVLIPNIQRGLKLLGNAASNFDTLSELVVTYTSGTSYKVLLYLIFYMHHSLFTNV